MNIIDEENEIRHKSKKNTRKWCKGKVGRLHNYQIEDVTTHLNPHIQPQRIYHQIWLSCYVCGRRDEYIGMFQEPEPWVVRRSRWVKEEKRARMQGLIDEYLDRQRNQGNEIARGTNTSAIS